VLRVPPTIRLGARPAPRRRPGTARWLDRLLDRGLGVSRWRRQAGYLAVASGLHLLRPMLRRMGLLAGALVVVAAASSYVRFVF
jgi:hypothetical protein